jgi:hypothetical protein
MANLSNLVMLRKAICKFQTNFDYGQYFSSQPVVLKELLSHDNECRTRACVAGFCLVLSRNDESFLTNQFEPGLAVAQSEASDDVWRIAQSWLELTSDEANWLFEPVAVQRKNFQRCVSATYLRNFEYDPTFPGSKTCTREQGYNEALRRLDFMIGHYHFRWATSFLKWNGEYLASKK